MMNLNRIIRQLFAAVADKIWVAFSPYDEANVYRAGWRRSDWSD